MYLFANSPIVDAMACKPTSPQLVAISLRMWTHSALVHR